MARFFEQDFEMSERRAAGLAQIGRSTLRYRSRRGTDEDVRDRLRALATERPRFGYRRLCVLLRREGLEINHKRVFRLYSEEGLTVRKKRRKRLSHAPPASDWYRRASRTSDGRWTSCTTPWSRADPSVRSR